MELHINGANIFKENPVTATILQNPINARAVFSRQSIQINNILYIYACSRADIITHSALQTRAHSTFTEIIC